MIKEPVLFFGPLSIGPTKYAQKGGNKFVLIIFFWTNLGADGARE